MTKVEKKTESYKKGDRTQQEKIRKRRHNLFKRIKEFQDRYEIETWVTMRMPTGRIYMFSTNPDEHAPTEEEIREKKLPVVHKTSADYAPQSHDPFVLRDPPPLPRQHDKNSPAPSSDNLFNSTNPL
ncbi:hypothetical protein BGW36DRAFT_303791 [Talaromyces proteolyticus]|uniref:MADS-box domain-containing protein n=1 Tax=Talaromyces proteolyticus TaxID=1131652 RepID=A0AAD4PSP1_9EURO|nr:uncharacterized protein BGW36DRAFT_303791 [Talaromyces proteolyticus]KAH8691811.1 hypothetical protein BGW36DRAFT_303791 [Talaromyces proteolyticus]